MSPLGGKLTNRPGRLCRDALYPRLARSRGLENGRVGASGLASSWNPGNGAGASGSTRAIKALSGPSGAFLLEGGV